MRYYDIYDFYLCICATRVHTSSQEPARRLDTLHVVLSGQPNATSKPKGLHTGFSGPLVLSLKAPLVICSYKKKDLLLLFYKTFSLHPLSERTCSVSSRPAGHLKGYLPMNTKRTQNLSVKKWRLSQYPNLRPKFCSLISTQAHSITHRHFYTQWNFIKYFHKYFS